MCEQLPIKLFFNCLKLAYSYKEYSQTYSEPCQTSTMKHFAKIVNGLHHFHIFANISILDVSQDFECKLLTRKCTDFTLLKPYSQDTGCKLNVHKTFRFRHGHPWNVFCTFNLRPLSRRSNPKNRNLLVHLEYI